MVNISSIDPILIPVTCYLALLALLGGIGNLIIMIATLKSRTLRSTCNMLIFFICSFDFCHLQGQWQYFVYMFTGREMEQAACLYWQILPLAGLYSCGPLQLGVAVDRLIAVSLPFKYMKLQHHPMKYFLCLFLPVVVYVLLSLWYGVTQVGHFPTPCSLPAAFSYEPNWYLDGILHGSYAAAAVIYILVVLVMRIKGANEQFKAVFKVITIYLGLILVTFLFTNVFDVAVEYFIPGTRYQKDILHAHAGIAITTCISSNLIVFYTMNRQYRAAVNRLFNFKRRRLLPPLQVAQFFFDIKYHTYFFHHFYDGRPLPARSILEFLFDRYNFEEEYHEMIFGTQIVAKICVQFSEFTTPTGRKYKLKVSRGLQLRYTYFAVGKEETFDGFLHDIPRHPFYDYFNETPPCTPTHIWKMETAVEPE